MKPYRIHYRWYSVNDSECRYPVASLKGTRNQAGAAFTLARKGTSQTGSPEARRIALNGTLDPLARANRMKTFRLLHYRARSVIIYERKKVLEVTGVKVWGLDAGIIHARALGFDMRVSNLRQDGRAFAFKVDASTSKARYARRSSPSFEGRQGRRLTSLCYHGWRDLIRALLDSGATRVQTMGGAPGFGVDVRSRAEFDQELRGMASRNIGSMMYSFHYIDACEDTHDPELEFVVAPEPRVTTA